MKFHVKRQSLLLTLKVLYLVGGENKWTNQQSTANEMSPRFCYLTHQNLYVINTKACHLGQCKPSSLSTKEPHVYLEHQNSFCLLLHDPGDLTTFNSFQTSRNVSLLTSTSRFSTSTNSSVSYFKSRPGHTAAAGTTSRKCSPSRLRQKFWTIFRSSSP